MNEKEVAELRRRFKADRSNITHVRGCYVNDKREIISEFDQPISMLSQDEGSGCWAFSARPCPGCWASSCWTFASIPVR